MNPFEKYIGCKIIQATPMMDLDFSREIRKIEGADGRSGYKVVYPDGYVSWSPKTVFEGAYRKITDEELALIAQ